MNSATDVDCGSLTDPVNGAISLTGTAFNSTATYSCNDGYNLVGVPPEHVWLVVCGLVMLQHAQVAIM